MWTRRRFLTRGLALFGAAGTALALPNETRETIPDGSASRGMVTDRSERAIEQGLSYLRGHQGPSGEFGTGGYRGNVAISSLAGLAFLSGGHQPGRGPYGKVVSDTLRYVLSTEDPRVPGFLHGGGGGMRDGPMYGHGFAALFLAEVCGMVPDPALRDKVRDVLGRAVQLILKCQNGEGGWRYLPTSTDADISVTICQIMALRAAKNAGIAVPKAQVDRCVKYVRNCQDRQFGFFRYQAKGGGGGPAFARTAAGVCALYSAGIYEDDGVRAGLDFLMKNRPNGLRVGHEVHYFYGHYYAAQAMWTAGGQYWQDWFPAIRDELVARQESSGAWMDMVCSHYATAMACIILQIPNNYLPILQK
jgi:hypothetical protein